MTAAHDRAGRKLLVASNGHAHRLELPGIGQTGVNALPERLCKRNSLGQWKSHRLSGELLSGHGAKVAIQAASVNPADTQRTERAVSKHCGSASEYIRDLGIVNLLAALGERGVKAIKNSQSFLR